MSIKANVVGPLVTLDCIDVLSVEDLDVLFQAFERANAYGAFAVITDTTRMKRAPHDVLSAFASRLKKAPHLNKAWLGDAVVIASPAVRFMVSTLLVIAPLPTEVKVFETLSEAKRWAEMLLRGRNLSTPAAPS